jgi:hypothetical protein
MVTYKTNTLRSADKHTNRRTKDDRETRGVQLNSYEKEISNGFPNIKPENSAENDVIVFMQQDSQHSSVQKRCYLTIINQLQTLHGVG